MSVGRMFLYANAALISGIIFGSIAVSPSPLLYIIGGLFLAVASFFFFRTRSILTVVLGVLFCAIGFLRIYSTFSNFQEAQRNFANAHPSSLEGQVISVLENDQGSKRAIVNTKYGKFVFFSFDTRILQGSTIIVACEEVKKEIDISEYASSGALATCSKSSVTHVSEKSGKHALEALRKKLNGSIESILPSPESALAQGILLGEKQSMPQDLKNAFRRTGTSHIVVLSGYNITILAFVLLTLFRRGGFSLRSSIGFCLTCIVFFVLLTGVTAPSVRAALMVSVLLLAKMRGRQSGGAQALLFSASAMIFASPLILGWSLSFQLSFLATLGLLASDRLGKFFFWIPEKFGLRDNAQTTLAATLFTLPLVAYQFGSFSLIGLLVNCIVLPLVPFAMALTAIAVALSLISHHAAFLFGAVPFAVLRGILGVIEFFGGFRFSSVTTNTFPPVILFLSYIVIGGIYLAGKKNIVIQPQPEKKSSYFFYVIFLIPCLAFTALRFDATKAVFFDVGQGDASLLHVRGGYDVLIDAGPNRIILSRLGRTLSYFNRTIEKVVLTHPHADHISGLRFILEKYEVKEVLITDADYQSHAYSSLLELLKQKNIPVRNVLTEENAFVQDMPLPLEILWPQGSSDAKDLNDASVVLKTSLGGASFLFMGDAGENVERILLRERRQLQADILKVGHHGSKTATSEAFLETVSPKVGIISVGADNKYGHPSVEALTRLGQFGVGVLRTDLCGTIEVVLNSKNGANIRSLCNLDK